MWVTLLLVPSVVYGIQWMSLVFVMTYCTGKIFLSGEIWVRVVFRAWDRILSGGAKKLPGQYTGRGEDLTPSLALGEHHKPQTGMCGDAHRGARCGEKWRKGLRRESWSVCSEPSQAAVSKEPSSWDSKEMTWTNTLQWERFQCKPAVTAAPGEQ